MNDEIREHILYYDKIVQELVLALDLLSSSFLGKNNRFVDSNMIDIASKEIKNQLLQKLVTKSSAVHSPSGVFSLEGLCNIDAIFTYVQYSLGCIQNDICDFDSDLNMETGSSLDNVYIATLLKRCGHEFSSYRTDCIFSFFFVLSVALKRKKCLVDPRGVCFTNKKLDDIKKQLKCVSTVAKAMSQIWPAFSQLVGIDLCTGLSQLPEVPEVLEYIDRWITGPGLNVERGKFIPLVIKATHSPILSVSKQDFIANLDSYLTGGSLIFSRSSRYRKLAKERAEEAGYIIESKHALPVLFTESELLDMLDNTVKHDISVVSASDYNKARFIASADIASYLRMKYIELNLKVCSTFWYNSTRIQLTQFVPTDEVLKDNALDYYRFKLPLDYAVFDSQPTNSEVGSAIEELCYPVDPVMGAKLWKGIIDGDVWYQNIKIGKYRHGIPSGWLWTNRLDSICNAGWILEAIERYRSDTGCTSEVWIRVNGDDVDARSNDTELLMAIPVILADMHLNVHPDKTSYRVKHTEYLRTLCGDVTEYGCRAINSVIDINRKNVQELKRSLMGDRAAIFERLSKWTGICTRFRNYDVNEIAIAEQCAWLRYRGNSQTAAMSYLATPTCRGGIGLVSVGLDFVRECTLTLVEPKIDKQIALTSLQLAVAKGGLRKKGSVLVEMERKVKKFNYGRKGKFDSLSKLLPIALTLDFLENVKYLVFSSMLTRVYSALTMLDKLDLSSKAGQIEAKELLIQSGLPRSKWRHILASGPEKSVFGVDLSYGKKWMSCITKRYMDSKKDFFIKPGLPGWIVGMVT